MKFPLITPTLFSAVISSVIADVPKQTPLYQYAGLWTDSPFTSKPPPPEAAPTLNPLNDFMLTGIAPVPGGYRITITNKKDPSIKELITPDSKGPFRIISVNRNPEQSLGTTVVLSNGSMQGTVSFEPDLVTLSSAPAAPQENLQGNPQQQPNLPPGVNPTLGEAHPNAGPRPRIVPPAPQGSETKSNTNKKNENQRPERR